MGPVAWPTYLLPVLAIFLDFEFLALGLGQIATEKIELHTPLMHYVFGGELRLSYRVLSPLLSSETYLADLVENLTDTSVHTQNLTLTPINTWSILDMPCSLLVSPGMYFVRVHPAGSSHPQIVSQPIEVRWLAAVDWTLSTGIIRTFADALTVNISLHSPTACPQQEPGKNFTLAINLIYKPQSGALVEVAWRGLQWPFGTTRRPRNSSILFPCQLFDQTDGGYYASLTLMRSGRKPVLLGQSPLVRAVHNQSDYSLLINGDLSKCRNNLPPSGAERLVRVSYRAPLCIGADKIRLYRIEAAPVTFPRNLQNMNQTYLMERSVRSRPRAASFNYPCHIFTAQQDALGFCWIYTSRSRDGQTRELSETRQCFPFSDAALKAWKLSDRPRWSDWTAWTTCTQTCRQGPTDQAVRIRNRVCLRNSSGIFRHNCEGASIETKACRLPLCQGANEEENYKFFDSVFLWFPTFRKQAPGVNNRTSIFVQKIYESDAETLMTVIEVNQKLLFLVIPAAGSLLLVLLCCVLPDTWKQFCKEGRLREKVVTAKDPNRDSHYALISKEDEPTTAVQLGGRGRQPYAHWDQPSRSGVMELRTLPSLKEKSSAENGDAISLADKRSPRWPIPHQSGRSSSNLSNSSRPDPGDVDFEYDDFIPDTLADEEEIWTPQHLDIKVFATAYEDIVKELNNSREESNL